MHSPEDIDFLEISDIASTGDAGPFVSVSNTDIVVDVFHLLSNKEDLSLSTDSPRGNHLESQNNDVDQDFPYLKVTNLPSKDLHGVWKSCAGVFPTHEILELILPSLVFETPIQFGLLKFIIRMSQHYKSR